MQCKKCPINEKDCSYKKYGNKHFDGVYNICMTDPREKKKQLDEDFRLREEEFRRRYGW